MRLYAQRIFVDDLATAKRFYGETLGLPMLWEWGPAVAYDVGAILLVEQEEREDDEQSAVGRFVGCSLAIEDIDATYADLVARGVPFLAPPEAMAWGGKLAHFRDPAGNVLTLFGEGKPATIA